MIQPLHKKPALDPSVLNNFRPIPKLSFLAKVLEKVVVGQLIDHLNDEGVFDQFQSGFRAGHSTETPLLRVLDDLLLAADNLTAAFDTVGHVISIERLKYWVGISDTALDWFYSYLNHKILCLYR